MNDFLCALRDIIVFWLFILVLLSAPVWAKWIDDESDAWERAVAEMHARMYEQLRSQK